MKYMSMLIYVLKKDFCSRKKNFVLNCFCNYSTKSNTMKIQTNWSLPKCEPDGATTKEFARLKPKIYSF